MKTYPFNDRLGLPGHGKKDTPRIFKHGTPKSWRFGSDDFPFFSWYLFPGTFVNFQGCTIYKTHNIHGTGIFTYIYRKIQSNVGKYTSPMDGRGVCTIYKNFASLMTQLWMIKIPYLKNSRLGDSTLCFLMVNLDDFEGNLASFRNRPGQPFKLTWNEASDDLIQISLPRVFDIQVGKRYHPRGNFSAPATWKKDSENKLGRNKN